MKILHIGLFICSGLLFVGQAAATSNSGMTITINKQEDVKTIPSSSGIEWNNGRLFAVSDDSPWLFEFNASWELQNKLTLREYEMENGRVPKKVKPDYEALADDGETLVVLSSGSKSPTRDFGYIIDSKTRDFKEIVLTDLYKEFKKAAHIPEDGEINIEAITAAEGSFFIFHRGNNSSNIAFKLAKDEFYAYFNGKSSAMPTIKVLEVTLPSIKNFASGFSGATYIPELKAFLITSSVEATEDAYNDGEILGSFIGYVPMADFTNGKDLTDVFKPIIIDGKPLITKLESITVKKIVNNKKLEVTAASDNDTGVSEFFELTLDL